MVGQQGSGTCLDDATLYLNVLETRGESRDNHEDFFWVGCRRPSNAPEG
jgi:hypothetical protein